MRRRVCSSDVSRQTAGTRWRRACASASNRTQHVFLLRRPSATRALPRLNSLRPAQARMASHRRVKPSSRAQQSGCLPRNSWNARITRANLTLRTIPIHNHQGSGIRASLRYPEDAAEHETSPISPGPLQLREKAAYPRASKRAGLPSCRRQARKL